jgi:Ni/Co efflux regulator RcnB
MRSHILKALGIAAAAMALATSTQAQGRGRDHGKDRDKHHEGQDDHRDRHDRHDRHDRRGDIHRADGDVFFMPRHRAGVPPGLAKKPGQMPPGQFKKRYTTLQGANTLGSILRRRGYEVQRIVPSGTSRVVYYRGRDGIVHRALVSPGTNRLGFSNVPSSLLQEVLSALY